MDKQKLTLNPLHKDERGFYHHESKLLGRTYRLGRRLQLTTKFKNDLSKLNLNWIEYILLNNSITELPKCKFCDNKCNLVAFDGSGVLKLNTISINDVCSDRKCINKKSQSTQIERGTFNIFNYSKSELSEINKRAAKTSKENGNHYFSNLSSDERFKLHKKIAKSSIESGNHISIKYKGTQKLKDRSRKAVNTRRIRGNFKGFNTWNQKNFVTYEGSEYKFSSKMEKKYFLQNSELLHKFYLYESSCIDYFYNGNDHLYVPDWTLQSTSQNLPDFIEIKKGNLFKCRGKDVRMINYYKFLSIINMSKSLLLVNGSDEILIDSFETLNKVFNM